MQEIQNECNFISVQPGQIYACGKVKLNLDIHFAYQNIVQYVYVHVCVCVYSSQRDRLLFLRLYLTPSIIPLGLLSWYI